MILKFVVGFIAGFCLYMVGYHMGCKAGTLRGMEELISIIKVFSPEVVESIGEVLHKAARMTPEEKENAFIDYLEKHDMLDE